MTVRYGFHIRIECPKCHALNPVERPVVLLLVYADISQEQYDATVRKALAAGKR